MDKLIILAAEEAEYNKCVKLFPEFDCVLMGVGAGNVIKTCCALPEGARVVNIGYAGSNMLPVGTVTEVASSYRLVNGNYNFVDHANPLKINDKGYDCYTGNDFVTATDKNVPVLFDMELNYIAAFSPRINLVASIKIVSDNLSIDVFRNNALRESGILTGNDVWNKVRDLLLAHI